MVQISGKVTKYVWDKNDLGLLILRKWSKTYLFSGVIIFDSPIWTQILDYIHFHSIKVSLKSSHLGNSVYLVFFPVLQQSPPNWSNLSECNKGYKVRA